ncbi:MAG: hypothetical protein NZ521_01100 [Flammeovirgaceae bacterium]|nr:hypothetical protein [Flammeovirgaceae bacterium]MDW8286703.1 hypothetical protein [Flammeovirgaceae bacterium]
MSFFLLLEKVNSKRWEIIVVHQFFIDLLQGDLYLMVEFFFFKAKGF